VTDVREGGLVPDRWLGVGDILGGALKFVWRYPVVTVGPPVGAFLVSVGVVLAALFVFGGFQLLPQYEFPEAMGVFGVLALYGLVAGSFVVGTHCAVLSSAVRGERVRLSGAWSAGLRSTPGLVAVHLLAGGIVASILAVGVLPFILTAALGDQVPGLLAVLIGLVGLGAVIVGLVVGVSLMMVGPAYVLDGGGVLQAISRSRELMYGSFWRVLGTMLLAHLMIQVVCSIVSTIGVFVALVVVSFLGVPPDLQFWAVGIGAGAALAASVPLTTGVLGLLYLDLRYRFQGTTHTA
jgi:hypothetical protein